jgi:hypothetical protein
VGGVSTSAGAGVNPTGVSMATSIGNILVWGEIDTNQTPSYNPISTT